MKPNAIEKKRMRTAGLAAVVAFSGMILAMLPARAQQDVPPPPPPQGQAQAPPHGRGEMMNPDRRSDRLQKELNLSADQTAQLKAIFAEGQTKGEALWHDTSLSREDRHAKLEALRQDQEAKIHAVLTDDQKTRYDAMQTSRRARIHYTPGSDSAPPPPPPPPPGI